MSTRKDLAWQALARAGYRHSDAAIVVADKFAFEGKPPKEAELEEYRAASTALVRANCECVKAIKMEAGK